eukprot:12061452-Alexandrium_andersonii.AAC.1
MSASLVGSEMCIRDSLARARGPEPADDAPQSDHRGSHHPSHVGYAPESVSYTHLTLPTICSV